MKRYCNVAIPHTRLGELTYEYDPDSAACSAGDCVRVPLRGRKVKSLVLDTVEKSPVARTLPVAGLLEPGLLDPGLLKLLRWVGAYYFGRMGEVLGLALPRGICGYGVRKRARSEAEEPGPAVPVVREAQAEERFEVRVLVSRHVQEQVAGFVAAGLGRGSVVVLSPESGVGRWCDLLRERAGVEPARYSGEQKASVRKRLWRELRRSEHRLVVGVRAAVFAPLTDLAAVVVLDEQDKVFKEERHPRVNARDVAIARARMCNCPVLLCTATPSLETWFNLKAGQYAAVPAGPEPATEPELSSTVVDMRKHAGQVFSPLLANELKEAVDAGASAVLYLNRLGLSRYVACEDCGLPLVCPDCGVPRVLMREGVLACGHCGAAGAAPDRCPACAGTRFRLGSPGIELAADEVRSRFPGAAVQAVLGDSVESRQAIAGRQSMVVVGTRALFAVEWPQDLKLVAALCADADLCAPDLRAGERAFQVLAELTRRAQAAGARLVIQTRRPEHPAVSRAIEGDAAGFLERELEGRKELEFPPFRRLVAIELSGAAPGRLERHAAWLVRRIGRAPGVEVLGPAPARGTRGAVQILVKLPRNQRLDRLITLRELEPRGVRVKVDVDPVEA